MKQINLIQATENATVALVAGVLNIIDATANINDLTMDLAATTASEFDVFFAIGVTTPSFPGAEIKGKPVVTMAGTSMHLVYAPETNTYYNL